jgi:hypothetical protein
MDTLEGQRVKPGPRVKNGCQEVGNHHRRPVRAAEGSGRRHPRCIAAHTSARVGRTATRLMAGGSGETKDHGREAHLRVKLLKVNKSSFEKTKSKNFKKMGGSEAGNG